MKPPARIAVGVFLLVGAVYVATAPGRIDIIDGQYRFEVAHNLLEHGSLQVRDPYLAGAVAGIGGLYSPYGISGSIVPLPLVALGRGRDPANIDRQQFFFSLTSPVLGAATAALLFLCYTLLGVGARTAVFWALAAAFATLAYPVATSTFDQTQHGFLVLAACALAFVAGRRDSMAAAAGAGVVLALLVNYQETYIILFPTIAVAALAASGTPADSPRRRLERCAVMMLIGGFGLLVWAGVNYGRFGSLAFSGKGQNHPPVLGNPVTAVAGLLFSPGKSILLYSPPILIAVGGIYHLLRRERALGLSVVATCVAYLGLISLLTFYGGDWCWGPRYFAVVLPVLALAYPFASTTTVRERLVVGVLLLAGIVVQLMAVSLDHHRFFYARSLSPFFWYEDRNIYFRESALVARVGELGESIRHGLPSEAESFRPGPYPHLLTYAVFGGWAQSNLSTPRWMRRYSVFWLPRPWPIWMATVPRETRPVDIMAVGAILLIMGATGVAAIRSGVRAP